MAATAAGGGDALLLETVSGASDLLPDGTAIFVSTVRFPRLYYLLATVAVALFGSLFLAGVSAADEASRAGLLSAAFVLFGAAGLALALWRRRFEAAYVAAREAGQWHQGVIVFHSGDVVVRMVTALGTVDRTIEAAYVSRAEVERGCAPHVCGFRDYLRLHYVGLDGRAAVLSVCQSDLVDPVGHIADFITDLKQRGMAF